VHTRLSSAKNVVASPLEFVRDLLAGHSLQTQAPGPEARELAELRKQVEELQTRLQTEKKHPRRAPKRKPRTRNSG
jgi:hypothetical protein